MLELISYNIAWGKKLDEAGAYLMALEKKPDILCFQEIPHMRLPSFKKALEQNGYTYKYAAGFTRKGITYGQLTAYNNTRFNLVLSQAVDLGTSLIGRIISRHNSKWSALFTVLRYGKKTIIVANVHLLPQALNRKRRKQLELTIQALSLLNFINIPTLIIGDYNYSSLTGRGGLIRFMAKHGFKSGTKKKLTTHRKWRISHQLDYVFYKNCKVKKIHVEKLKFSDHYPVFVSVEA